MIDAPPDAAKRPDLCAAGRGAVAMADNTVLISGMGIAGPTLAYWIGNNVLRPTLVERAPRPRTGGYVIDFWGLGYDVAERMGLIADILDQGYDVQEIRLVDPRGRHVGGFGVDVFRELTDGRYVSVRRGELAALLHRRIEGYCETIFDDSVSAIAQDGDGVQVSFERTPARRFGLVIGADGLHSAVRGIAFGPQHQFEAYLGYMVAAFESVGYRPRDENVYVACTVPGKQVARFAMRDDRTVFLFIFAADQPPPVAAHDIAAQKAVLRETFGDVGWECPAIFAELDRTEELYFDRVSQIRMEAWSRGRIALVGDAAFCPSLLAGEGSALAMAAGYVLGNELTRSAGRFDEAFRRYEDLLRPVLTRKQKAAVQFARSFAPRTRFGLLVRNLVTRAFAIPGVARLTLGRSVLDHVELPDYPVTAERSEPALHGSALRS
jgi:2-polyprenyl-6-methoxyphenol hydroxylase-like FAD-dependent oxidoreductase